MQKLGAALRSLRVFHDLSQTDVARKLQVSKSYLSEIESGKKEPTVPLLSQYSTLFSVPLSSLLFFAEHIEGSSSTSGAEVIAPKILRLLDWISDVKSTGPIQRKRPAQAEHANRRKTRNQKTA
jgi:transcriptional regulator with XRE-family HTH domain